MAHQMRQAFLACILFAVPVYADDCELEFGAWEVGPSGTGVLEVLWESPNVLGGYQFNLSGIEVLNMHGGLTEQMGWYADHDEDTVLAFAFGPPYIDPQSDPSVLTIIEFQVVGSVISFAPSIVFATPSGEELEVDADDTIILPSSCPDPDGDGETGFGDLLMLLASWGPCSGCPEDIDASGDVGFNDILLLLAAWGPCPP